MGRSSIFGRACGAGDDSGAGDVAPGATKARRASRPLLIFFRRKRSPEKRGPRCALFIAGRFWQFQLCLCVVTVFLGLAFLFYLCTINQPVERGTVSSRAAIEPMGE